MIIRREKRSERFSVLNTEPIEDKNLSAVALGIYVYIMSKPDNWNAHKNEILKRFGGATIKTSKNVIDSAFSELIKAGYIVLKTIVSRTDENKVRFAGKEYLFFDTPQLSKDNNCRETEIMEAREKSKIDKTRKSKEVAHITNTDLITNINNITNTDLITNKEKSDFSFLENDPEIIALNDKKQDQEILPAVVYQKPKKEKAPQIYPANFSPAIIRAVENFIEYRKEIKKPFKSEKSQQTKVNQWSDQIEAYGDLIVLDSIETAIANGWQGTFIDMKKVEQLNKQQINSDNQFKTKEDATFSYYFSQLRDVDYGFND